MSKKITRLLIALVSIHMLSVDLHAADFILPDTGQTKCYDDTDEMSSCPKPGEPFYGQDGNYVGLQPALHNNGNGAITDLITGLMWQQADDGQERTWDESKAYCETLTLGNYLDWRLPDAHELESIVNAGYNDPAIDADEFDCISADYWSSDSRAPNGSGAWNVDFWEGYVSTLNKTIPNNYVRCVRFDSSHSTNANIRATFQNTPNSRSVVSRYVDNNDGTILDTQTELMWQQADDAATYSWQQALHHCENLIIGVHSDWRLPNKRELHSIVDFSKDDPAVDPVFECRSAGYWTGSSSDWDPSSAWYTLFEDGSTEYDLKGSSYFVRCVRGATDLTLYVKPDGDCGTELAPWCYRTIQEALNVEYQGMIRVKITQDHYNENLTAATEGSYQLMGGYDAGFTQQTGKSTINGSLKIKSSKILVNDILISGQ